MATRRRIRWRFLRVGFTSRAVHSVRLLEFGLIAVLSLAPFLWRVLAGANDLPAGDAWAYERIFTTFHETGHVQLVGWNDITLVAMIPVTSLWVAIVGYGDTQIHLLGSVMCAIALLGFRSLLLTFGVIRRTTALLLLAGFTGFVGIAGTYLSDSFAIAGAVWALALAYRATCVREGCPHTRSLPPRLTWLAVAGSALAASFAFLVRQQMLVAAVAAAWILWRHDRKRHLAVFGSVFIAISLPIYLWRSGLEHGGQIEFDLRLRGIVAGSEALFIAQGLLLFAVMLWVPSWHPITKRGAALVGGLAIGEFALLAASWSQVKPAYPLAAGLQEQYGLDGGAIALVAVLAAATTGWVWTIRASVEWRDRRPHLTEASLLRHQLASVALLGIAVEGAVIVATGAYFPRYSLFVGCAVIVVIMARPLQRSTAAAIVTGVVLVASFWELDYSLTPTDAIQQASRITSCLGINPENLDATFSWDGKHYTGIASVFRGELDSDGLPVTADWSTFPAMKRDAVLTPTNPGTNADWLLIGPIDSSALIPTTEQQWWLTVRQSAIKTTNQAACLDH